MKWTSEQDAAYDRLDDAGVLSPDQIRALVFGYWDNRGGSSVDAKAPAQPPARPGDVRYRGGPDSDNHERAVGLSDLPEHIPNPHLSIAQQAAKGRGLKLGGEVIRHEVLFV